MSREEFLKKLFSMFPSTFNKDNAPYWLEAYTVILTPDLDYDKLFRYFTRSWDSMRTPPSPQWFVQFMGSVRENRSEIIGEVEKWKEEPRYEIPKCYEDMKKRLWGRGLLKDIESIR